MLRIRPYILAGGKSSRMGRDKAMLDLEGKTLLARAVEMLRSVQALGSRAGHVEVTICGAREVLEGANRAIIDRYSECGPLGGIEAALRDLEGGDIADWAFFVPVDMPLLSVALIDRLLEIWTDATLTKDSIRACMVEVQGRVQPLVSLVHRSVHTRVQTALEAGRYKVVPVLQSAQAFCTSVDQELRPADRDSAGSIFSGPGIPREEPPGLNDKAEAALGVGSSFNRTHVQFTNINTENDLIEVATFLRRKGSYERPTFSRKATVPER